ncbi:MAG: DNA primase, partial [Deltaproteobacteria bacterium]|nr:DNA primase [Deltaproteobacteria bacterium]
KRVADIAELIGQYVQIKKAGLNYMGLCPFHSEKAPSFTVSPAKQMFHCFGCKKGGDIFAFWMEYHKVSFPQAMRDLAQRYNVTLPERKLTPAQKRKMELQEELFKINGSAAEYFHHILTESDKGEAGRGYLEKRSVDKDCILEFKLGYAPDKWDGLAIFLRSKKVDMGKAAQAGLVISKKNGGYYDRFRGRVIFPIYNLRKQIAGFGGRVLDDSLPKYLNSPETPIFRKGDLLYGLHVAYEHIRATGRVVIVEGYTDVLALRRHGFNEAVATLGTSMTKDHIRGLKGYAKEAVVVFDSDKAGKMATIKSLPLFQNEGLSSRVMVLPEGDDPDSFVNKNGLNVFLDLLNSSMPMFDFYLNLSLSQSENGVDGQVGLLKEVLPVLADLDSDSQRSLYIRRFSEKSGISESIVWAELRKQQTDGKGREEGLRRRLADSTVKRSDDIPMLNLLIHSPQSMRRLMTRDCKLLLSDPIVMEIFDSMCEICNNEQEFTPEEILERLEGESVQERFREAMLSPRIYPDEMVELAIDEFENRIKKIKLSESINRAREHGNIEELNQLLKLKSRGQGRRLL